MDIGKAFTSSFEGLKKNKSVIVPILISLIVPIILVFVYLHISGLYDVVIDAVYLAQEYDEKKADYVFSNYNLSDKNYTSEALGYFSGRGEYRKGLVDYWEANGIITRSIGLLNLKNIIWGIFFITSITILSIYLSCASYAIVLLSIRKEKLDYRNTISLTNKFWSRYILTGLLLFIITFVPISLGILLMVLSFLLNLWIGVISIILFIVFMIIYLVFISVRLLFVYPILFYDDMPSSQSIKKCFTITKNNFKQLLIVFGIMYGIGATVNSIGFTPFFESFYNLLLPENILKSISIFFLIVFFLLVGSFVSAFQILFLFYSYLDLQSSKTSKISATVSAYKTKGGKYEN